MAENRKEKSKVIETSSRSRSYVPLTHHVSSHPPITSDVPSPTFAPHIDRPVSTPSTDASAPASSRTQKIFVMPRGLE